MSGFHAGGFEEAKRTMKSKLDRDVGHLRDLLKKTPRGNVEELIRIERQIDELIEKYEEQVASLRRSFF